MRLLSKMSFCSTEKWGVITVFSSLSVSLFMSQMRIYLGSVNTRCLFKEWKIYTVLVQK